ncbi:MAG TPA: hypothetical protein VL523_19125 [Terriglobia bacterium]|nr:hypothetical protein [Terriglobia bacterium]
MRKLLVGLSAVALLVACGRWRSHSSGAVEQAIKDHLNQNTHLLASSFDTRVETVNINGDTADALVKFQSKQSASIFVEVRYGLHFEKGRWEVMSSAPMSGQGGDSHGQSQAGPPASPPGTQSGTPRLQPSH